MDVVYRSLELKWEIEVYPQLDLRHRGCARGANSKAGPY